ncbi:MAG: MerR family transcriptional regulator, partial [Actinomycetota bacterium]
MNELNRSDDARYELDVLFSDGMPERDENAGYRGAEAAKAAGITYRQLDYWARTSLLRPSLAAA